MTAWTLAATTPGGLVEQIGSYAGYASVIGLGIMALLYFGQAREVKRLREWAGRAPERALELEQRPQPDLNRRVIAQPLAPSTTAAQTAAAATAALYASVGATAPGAPAPPGQLARPGAPTPPAAAPGSLAPGAVPAPAAAGSAPGSAPGPAPATAPPRPPPRRRLRPQGTEGAAGARRAHRGSDAGARRVADGHRHARAAAARADAAGRLGRRAVRRFAAPCKSLRCSATAR